MIIGYTAGAFDLFHIGHLNLLKNSKARCDKLIVGVSSDELIYNTKGKKPVIHLKERIKIVEAIKYVDEIHVQKDLDKIKAWEKYHYDILFIGDDWKGNKRWDNYEKILKTKGVPIIYLPYTKTTSSTLLTKTLKVLSDVQK